MFSRSFDFSLHTDQGPGVVPVVVAALTDLVPGVGRPVQPPPDLVLEEGPLLDVPFRENEGKVLGLFGRVELLVWWGVVVPSRPVRLGLLHTGVSTPIEAAERVTGTI